MNDLQRAMKDIHASAELKQSTAGFLRKEREKRQHRHTPVRKATLLACACAFLLAIGLGGWQWYETPVSYISIDVNPSLELSLNRIDRVVEVTAYNADGEQVLEDISLENMTYTNAIEALLANDSFDSYVDQNGALTFTVVSDKESELTTGIEGCAGYAEHNASCTHAGKDVAEEAHESGCSVGKYQAYLTLKQYDSSITLEECQNMTMHEIRKRIAAYRGTAVGCSDNTDSSNSQSGNHSAAKHHGKSTGSTTSTSSSNSQSAKHGAARHHGKGSNH